MLISHSNRVDALSNIDPWSFFIHFAIDITTPPTEVAGVMSDKVMQI